MNQLRVVNSQRQTMAIIQWQPPDQLHIQSVAPQIESQLLAIVEATKVHGLPFYISSQGKQTGHSLIIDEQILINVHDYRFLSALTDAINHYRLDGQRVFGILEEQSSEGA